MEVQAFDDRGVGEPEQVELGVGLQRPRHPGRDDEEVAAADGMAVLAEPDVAGAVEHLADAGPDLAAGLGVRARPQPVELGADGGHDVAAGGRVGVADRGVAGLGRGRVPLVLERELLAQRGVGVLPAVGRDRRTAPGVQADQRTEAGVRPQPLGRETCGVDSSVTPSRPNSKKPVSV